MPASFSHLSRVSWEFHLHGYYKLKGTVSRNLDKLGNYKMPVTLRET